MEPPPKRQKTTWWGVLGATWLSKSSNCLSFIATTCKKIVPKFWMIKIPGAIFCLVFALPGICRFWVNSCVFWFLIPATWSSVAVKSFLSTWKPPKRASRSWPSTKNPKEVQGKAIKRIGNFTKERLFFRFANFHHPKIVVAIILIAGWTPREYGTLNLFQRMKTKKTKPLGWTHLWRFLSPFECFVGWFLADLTVFPSSPSWLFVECFFL